MVGNALDSIAEVLTHLRRHIYAEHLLHDVADTALAGLGVDTNNIALVFSADIHGVDGKIRNVPVLGILFLSPLHALCDSVLVRT